MKTTVENVVAGEDITESVTGEYPVIREADLSSDEPRNGTRVAGETDAEKAAFWLTHLEIEVKRLHAKWHSIDAEFKVREARIAELREELGGRDATIEKLTADLRSGAEALQAADERLASKDADVAGFIADAKERDRKLQDLSTLLGQADDRYRALHAALTETQAEVARLQAAVRQEQEISAGFTKLNGELLADQASLRAKLQDLETYIDGRHDSWLRLNAELAAHKEALAALERAVESRDAAAAQFDTDKRELAERIVALERECAELVGRGEEREAAYENLQRKLAEQIESTEKLKADHANRTKEADEAVARAAESERRVAVLQREVARLGENLASASAELELRKTSAGELAATNEKLTARIDHLESALREQVKQAETLGEDLESRETELDALEARLAERTAELAASRAQADEKARLADALSRDQLSLEKDSADVREQLARLEDHAAELGNLRADALAESERLKTALAAQQRQIAALEAQLVAKQEAADLLERNVGRITDLGASLEALDRQMDGSESSRVRDHAFVETLAVDDAPAEPAEVKELLPADAMVTKESGDVVPLRVPGKRTGVRKLVAMLGGQGIDFPLIKKEMTIGRGHGSDIRIASHFISRIHAKISTNGIATIIEDAGSKNGVLVNSERVQRRILRDGDIVSLGGELNMRFVDGAP